MFRRARFRKTVRRRESPSRPVSTSALTSIPVRADLAMTGEITVRGRVLPIGGLKEKLLAAHRHGIREVVLPADNEKDLPDIPEIIRKEMKMHFVIVHGRGAEAGAGEGNRYGADVGDVDRRRNRGAVQGR